MLLNSSITTASLALVVMVTATTTGGQAIDRRDEPIVRFGTAAANTNGTCHNVYSSSSLNSENDALLKDCVELLAKLVGISGRYTLSGLSNSSASLTALDRYGTCYFGVKPYKTSKPENMYEIDTQTIAGIIDGVLLPIFKAESNGTATPTNATVQTTGIFQCSTEQLQWSLYSPKL